jgi:hypothetical protein
MGMGLTNAMGQPFGMNRMNGTGGKGGAQDNQVYYDSSKGAYYTMAQPQNQSPLSPVFSQFNQAAAGMGGKGTGEDGRTYLSTSLNQNNGSVNSLANYTAPQFQQQQNPYMNYYAQQQQQRNPYAQTQFGQMPGQQPSYQQQYYQGPFSQYGMGGKGGFQQQQNPYSQQSYYQGPFQQYGMGGKGGMQQQNMNSYMSNSQQYPRYQGMGGKGKGNS